jgi:hypothetical protein
MDFSGYFSTFMQIQIENHLVAQRCNDSPTK